MTGIGLQALLVMRFGFQPKQPTLRMNGLVDVKHGHGLGSTNRLSDIFSFMGHWPSLSLLICRSEKRPGKGMTRIVLMNFY